MSKLLLTAAERSRYDRMTLGSSGVAPSITSPEDLSNVTHWYDAADTATITHASNAVSLWSNKHGGVGNNLEQATAANKPVTNTRTVNGKNVIDFDGSNDFLWSGEWLWANRVTGSTLFVAFMSDINTGTAQLIGSSRTVSNNTRWGIGLYVSTFYRPFQDYSRDDGAVINDVNGPSAVAASTPYVIAATQQVTNDTTSIWTIGKNAEARTSESNITTNAAGTTPDVIMVGSWRWNSTGARPFNGVIMEIIRYAGLKSEGDILLVNQYLQTKWAI